MTAKKLSKPIIPNDDRSVNEPIAVSIEILNQYFYATGCTSQKCVKGATHCTWKEKQKKYFIYEKHSRRDHDEKDKQFKNN